MEEFLTMKGYWHKC